MKKSKKVVYYILLALLSIILAVSATVLIIKLIPEKSQTDKYKKQISSADSSTVEELAENPIDFNALEADNKDVIGWIKVDGTAIDYPVLMSSFEKDNNYYIDHDFYCKQKRAGSIYAQRSNTADFTDFNTVLYGHNMLNGSMFGTLKRFRNKNFFNENRNLYIYTKGHILKYEIVSAFIYDDRLLYTFFNFNVDDGRNQFIDTVLNPQTNAKNVLEGASITVDDKLITLSTCTSVDSERYLVVAKLISDTKTN